MLQILARIGKRAEPEQHAIVYGQLSKSGPIRPQYPGKYVVLIALEDLSKDNGLPSWSNDSPETMQQGDSVLLSGDEEQRFYQGKGGGLILVLVFNIQN